MCESHNGQGSSYECGYTVEMQVEENGRDRNKKEEKIDKEDNIDPAKHMPGLILSHERVPEVPGIPL